MDINYPIIAMPDESSVARDRAALATVSKIIEQRCIT